VHAHAPAGGCSRAVYPIGAQGLPVRILCASVSPAAAAAAAGGIEVGAVEAEHRVREHARA
jgi:hypothetical protein